MDFHVAVPGPFTYLVHEHARSIVAIQELQQEVSSLLEFRDHVLETLPHLHHHHPPCSSPTHDHPAQLRPAPPPPTTRADTSPSKGGEGARQQQRGGLGGVSSSSSSTGGGGKSLSETHSSSAVADSGFSTDKAGGSMGKSSSSSAGEQLSGAEAEDPRWTCVESEAPLGSAEDELWQLLDVIQRKGTRLRAELERAEQAERDHLSTGHHAPASDPLLACPRPQAPQPHRDYWPYSLPPPTAADFLPPPPPMAGAALEAEAWAAVDRLRQDRQYLMGRVGWAEAEAAASHQRLADLHGQLLALAGDRRRLEDQVRALRPPGASPHLGGHSTVTINTEHSPIPPHTTTTASSRVRRPASAVTVSVAGQEVPEEATGPGRGVARVRSASSVRLNEERERDVVLPRVLKVPIRERTPRPVAPASVPTPAQAPAKAEDESAGSGHGVGTGVSGRGSDRVVIERERRAGRADGGLSMPVSLLKGARLRVTPNKQRISAILREKDVIELQRQLLTTVMEAEVLHKQVEAAGEEWSAKSSEWETERRLTQTNIASLKEENTRLRRQLEERVKTAATPTATATKTTTTTTTNKRDVGVTARPSTTSTATLTRRWKRQVEVEAMENQLDEAVEELEEEEDEEATHTVHQGPNVKYDVVIHEESTSTSASTTTTTSNANTTSITSNNRTSTSATTTPHGRRNGLTAVEKPPRRGREPRSNTNNNSTTIPPLRETAESPVGRETASGRAMGHRARLTGVSSSRGTPTSTPRSSPAPSINSRLCATRATPQDAPRGSPVTRGTFVGSGGGGGSSRVSIARRDSMKMAHAKAGGGGKGGTGGGGSTSGSAGGSGVSSAGQKVAPPRSAEQGNVGQPRPVKEPVYPSPRSPHLRTPSPTITSPAPCPSPTHHHRPTAKTRPVIHNKVASGAETGTVTVGRAEARAGRYTNTGAARGKAGHSGINYITSHLQTPTNAPATPSPSPPASYSSYYDSINSEGHAPSPAPDRVMQVEVAFEWSPVTPVPGPGLHPQQAWPPNPTPSTPAAGLIQVHGPARTRTGPPRPWPPDSLEAVERPEGTRGTPPRPVLAPQSERELNNRVHQILARIASGGI